MATAKKTTTTKKTSAAKKPAPKKAAPKRAPAKTTAVKTKVSSVKRAPVPAATVKSFRRSKPEQRFLSFKPGVQTIYWVILGILVLSLGLWVATISMRVQALYDQIDANNEETDSVVVPSSNF